MLNAFFSPRPRFISLLRDYLIIAMVMLVLTFVAFAKPPDGADPSSALSQWYHSLKSPLNGGSCCSEADCRPTLAKIVDDHWEIKLEDTWLPVPSNVVLKRNNEDGRPVACVMNGIILCFVPPSAV